MNDWVPFEDRPRPDADLLRVRFTIVAGCVALTVPDDKEDKDNSLGRIFAWLQGQTELARQGPQIGTHGPGCWAWGPRHHACALAEILRLQEETPDGGG